MKKGDSHAHRGRTGKAFDLRPAVVGLHDPSAPSPIGSPSPSRGLSFAIVGGLVYVTYIVEMTSYDDFRKCNKSSTVTRIEWVLGFRPADDCRRF